MSTSYYINNHTHADLHTLTVTRLVILTYDLEIPGIDIKLNDYTKNT